MHNVPSRSGSRGSSRRGAAGGGAATAHNLTGDAQSFRQWTWSVADDVIALRGEFNALRASLHGGDLHSSAAICSSISMAQTTVDGMLPSASSAVQESAIGELKDEFRTLRCAVEAECTLLRREVETLRLAQSQAPPPQSQDEFHVLRCAVEAECAQLRREVDTLRSSLRHLSSSSEADCSPKARGLAAHADGDHRVQTLACGACPAGHDERISCADNSDLVSRVRSVEEAVLDLGRELVCLAEQSKALDVSHTQMHEDRGEMWDSLERMANEVATRLDCVEQVQGQINTSLASVQEASSNHEIQARTLSDDFSAALREMGSQFDGLSREFLSQQHKLEDTVARLRDDRGEQQVTRATPLAIAASPQARTASSSLQSGTQFANTTARGEQSIPGSPVEFTLCSPVVLQSAYDNVAVSTALQANPRLQPSEAIRVWRAFATWMQTALPEARRSQGRALSQVDARCGTFPSNGPHSGCRAIVQEELEVCFSTVESRLLSEVQCEVQRHAAELQHAVRNELSRAAEGQLQASHLILGSAESSSAVRFDDDFIELREHIRDIATLKQDAESAVAEVRSWCDLGPVEEIGRAAYSSRLQSCCCNTKHLEEELGHLRQDLRHDRSAWQSAFEGSQQQARLERAQMGRQLESVEQKLLEQCQEGGASFSEIRDHVGVADASDTSTELSAMQHDLSEHHTHLLSTIEAVLEQRGSASPDPHDAHRLQLQLAGHHVDWSEALGEFRGCVKRECSALFHDIRAEMAQPQHMSQASSKPCQGTTIVVPELACERSETMLDDKEEATRISSVVEDAAVRKEVQELREIVSSERVYQIEMERALAETKEMQDATRDREEQFAGDMRRLLELDFDMRKAQESTLQYSVETRHLYREEMLRASEIALQLRGEWQDDAAKRMSHVETLEKTCTGLRLLQDRCDELCHSEEAAAQLSTETHNLIRAEFAEVSEFSEELRLEWHEDAARQGHHVEMLAGTNREVKHLAVRCDELSHHAQCMRDQHVLSFAKLESQQINEVACKELGTLSQTIGGLPGLEEISEWREDLSQALRSLQENFEYHQGVLERMAKIQEDANEKCLGTAREVGLELQDLRQSHQALHSQFLQQSACPLEAVISEVGVEKLQQQLHEPAARLQQQAPDGFLRTRRAQAAAAVQDELLELHASLARSRSHDNQQPPEGLGHNGGDDSDQSASAAGDQRSPDSPRSRCSMEHADDMCQSAIHVCSHHTDARHVESMDALDSLSARDVLDSLRGEVSEEHGCPKIEARALHVEHNGARQSFFPRAETGSGGLSSCAIETWQQQLESVVAEMYYVRLQSEEEAALVRELQRAVDEHNSAHAHGDAHELEMAAVRAEVAMIREEASALRWNCRFAEDVADNVGSSVAHLLEPGSVAICGGKHIDPVSVPQHLEHECASPPRARDLSIRMQGPGAEAGAPDLHEVLMMYFPDAPWPSPSTFESELRSHLRSLGTRRMDDISMTLREGIVVELRGYSDVLADIHDLPLSGTHILGYPLGLVWKTLASGPSASDHEGVQSTITDATVVEHLLAQHGRMSKDVRSMFAKVQMQHQSGMRIETELKSLALSHREKAKEIEEDVANLKDELREASSAWDPKASHGHRLQQQQQQLQPQHPQRRDDVDDTVVSPKRFRTSVEPAGEQLSEVFLDQGVVNEWREGVSELRGALCRAWAAEDSRTACIAATGRAIDVAPSPVWLSELHDLAKTQQQHASEMSALKDALANALHDAQTSRIGALSSEESVKRFVRQQVADARALFTEEFEKAREAVNHQVGEHAASTELEFQNVHDHLAKSMDDGVALRRQVLMLCEAKHTSPSSTQSPPLASMRTRLDRTEDALADLRGRVAEAVEVTARARGDVARLEVRLDAGDQHSARGLGCMQQALEALQGEMMTLRKVSRGLPQTQLAPCPAGASSIVAARAAA